MPFVHLQSSPPARFEKEPAQACCVRHGRPPAITVWRERRRFVRMRDTFQSAADTWSKISSHTFQLDSSCNSPCPLPSAPAVLICIFCRCWDALVAWGIRTGAMRKLPRSTKVAGALDTGKHGSPTAVALLFASAPASSVSRLSTAARSWPKAVVQPCI